MRRSQLVTTGNICSHKVSRVLRETRVNQAETGLQGRRVLGAGLDWAAKTARSAGKGRLGTSGPEESLRDPTRAKRASLD